MGRRRDYRKEEKRIVMISREIEEEGRSEHPIQVLAATERTEAGTEKAAKKRTKRIRLGMETGKND